MRATALNDIEEGGSCNKTEPRTSVGEGADLAPVFRAALALPGDLKRRLRRKSITRALHVLPWDR